MFSILVVIAEALVATGIATTAAGVYLKFLVILFCNPYQGTFTFFEEFFVFLKDY